MNFRILRDAFLIISKSVQSDLRFFGQIAAILVVLYFVAASAFDYWRMSGCITEVRATSVVSGLNFEVSETDCWHNPETSVFVSKSGENRKTLLFAYASRLVPTITPVDERTVRIGLGDIDHVFCRTVRWDDLTIEYDIGAVRSSKGHPDPRQC
jgi:hypothetical protein